MKNIKVLIIDDSALVREILENGLSEVRGIEVVGTAPDPFVARDKIMNLLPDVLTLDIEMPRMDGVEFLRRLMPQYPLPVIIVSALSKKGAEITLAALDAGAIDYITKPSTNIKTGLYEMIDELAEKIKMAASVDVSGWKETVKSSVPKPKLKQRYDLYESTDKVIAIGASTGGTIAIRQIISNLPLGLPGIVIVQHMPPGFTYQFAKGLNLVTDYDVVEARSGDWVLPGKILIAPGGFQMTVKRAGGVYFVECKPGDKVNGHCPSVEVLFQSVAEYVGANAVGIMLTGMGGDGSDGMLAMRNAGGRTFAQDEATSVVFGMPKEAYVKGGAECLVPLQDMPLRLIGILTNMKNNLDHG